MRKVRAAKIRPKPVLRKSIPPEAPKSFWWWLMLETVKAALAVAARHWFG